MVGGGAGYGEVVLDDGVMELCFYDCAEDLFCGKGGGRYVHPYVWCL
jgi:hypothetical protein